MNNTVRTIIVIYIVVFAVICLFFIPCKQFSYVDTKAIFTGVRDIYSVFELYQIRQITPNYPYFYYIDWQVLWIELLPLTIITIGSVIAFKEWLYDSHIHKTK